ncbi:MAG: glycosyltransferase family 39 protein [Caldilineaceae bacterium]
MTATKINKSGLRILLLLLILLAFGRAVLWLDAKALWWDESLTLQRAESDWGALLRGQLMIDDNVAQWPTTDQHPFTFFVLVGILIRLAGDSEFVLRFPSVMAVTLLPPTVWCMARLLVRRAILAERAPIWAAFVAAFNPFYLWYGQETRPYALLTWLGLLSTYLLLRTVEIRTWRALRRSGWFWGYVGVTAAFLTTHYYAPFLMPIHLLLIWRWLARHGERKALAWMTLLALLGAGLGGLAARRVLSNSSGANFDDVPLRILLPDLLNAFTLGPSADIGIGWIWALDLLGGLIGLMAALWALRNWATIRDGGWLLPAFVLVPIVMIRLVELIQPGYMNARHMSVAGGGWLLLLGGGLALIWQRQRWAALALAILMILGASYSSYAYFFGHEYQKDDFAALGRFMGRRMLPGDLVLLNPRLRGAFFTITLHWSILMNITRRTIQQPPIIGPRAILACR